MAAGLATGGGRPAANRPRSPQTQVEPPQQYMQGDSSIHPHSYNWNPRCHTLNPQALANPSDSFGRRPRLHMQHIREAGSLGATPQCDTKADSYR